MGQSGRKPGTIRHVVILLRAVYAKARVWRLYAGETPGRTAAPAKGDARRARYLTPEEARLLLAELKKRSLTVWRQANISLQTGMRAGEIMALRGEHIDLAADTIRIADSKSGKARSVYITGALKEIFVGMDLKNGQLLFPARGKDGRQTDISSSFARAVEAMGLNRGISDPRDKVVFHSLRHTFASWLVQRGVPLYTVASLLGHSSMVMTQRYAHLSPDVRRAAVENIDKIICHG
jgi:integrase